MKKIYVSLVSLFASLAGFSQVNLSNGSGTYTETFDAMGTAAVATLPANWRVATSTTPRTVGPYAAGITTTNYRAGNNMTTTDPSGVYNFGAGDPAVATDRALGALGGGSGTIQGVTFYVLLKNNGTTAIDNFTVSYDVEKYRRGTVATSMTMYYSTDASGNTFTSAVPNGVPAASFLADPDNNGVNPAPSATTQVRSNTFTVSLGVGSTMYLAFNYSPTAGVFTTNDAIALGLDSVKIVANFANTLPLNLSNFKVAERTNAVNLSWTAFNETNMVRHDIERSSNGSSFTSIGSVAAQNNRTSYNYNYLDATPTQGTNYYRLRSVSNTGEVSYSNILRINLGARKTDLAILSNPVVGRNVNLQLSNFNRGQYAINVFNNVGQKVFTQSMNLTGGSSTEIVSLPSGITRGNYFLQFTNGSTNITRQMLVQ
jgi:hypothetical protein